MLLHHEHKGHMMRRMMSMRWEREKERKEKKNERRMEQRKKGFIYRFCSCSGFRVSLFYYLGALLQKKQSLMYFLEILKWFFIIIMAFQQSVLLT